MIPAITYLVGGERGQTMYSSQHQIDDEVYTMYQGL